MMMICDFYEQTLPVKKPLVKKKNLTYRKVIATCEKFAADKAAR